MQYHSRSSSQEDGQSYSTIQVSSSQEDSQSYSTIEVSSSQENGQSNGTAPSRYLPPKRMVNPIVQHHPGIFHPREWSIQSYSTIQVSSSQQNAQSNRTDRSGQGCEHAPEQHVNGSTFHWYSSGLRLAISQADAWPIPISLRC